MAEFTTLIQRTGKVSFRKNDTGVRHHLVSDGRLAIDEGPTMEVLEERVRSLPDAVWNPEQGCYYVGRMVEQADDKQALSTAISIADDLKNEREEAQQS